MGIWFLLLIPVLSLLALKIFFHKNVVFWEYSLPLVVGIITILTAKLTTESINTSDVQYLSHYVLKANHFERWNEYIHRTCTRTVSCGKNCTRTQIYDCSYVQNHPEYWEFELNSGYSVRVDESYYKKLVTRFGNEQFIDMSRNYYSIDGDAYQTVFDNDFNKLEYIITEDSYENRVQVSHDIFNFPEVDSSEIEKYGLYDYPSVSNLKQNSILGYNDKELDRYANKKNALIGNKKQLRFFFLFYKNQSREASHYQRNLWKGGNKNEFNIAICLDDNNKILWCEPFTWSESTMCNVKIRDYIQSRDSLDMKSIVDFTYDVLKNDYKRKEFSDFNYLTVDPSPSQVKWIAVILIVVTIGVCCYVVLNPFDN